MRTTNKDKSRALVDMQREKSRQVRRYMTNLKRCQSVVEALRIVKMRTQRFAQRVRYMRIQFVAASVELAELNDAVKCCTLGGGAFDFGLANDIVDVLNSKHGSSYNRWGVGEEGKERQRQLQVRKARIAQQAADKTERELHSMGVAVRRELVSSSPEEILTRVSAEVQLEIAALNEVLDFQRDTMSDKDIRKVYTDLAVLQGDLLWLQGDYDGAAKVMEAKLGVRRRGRPVGTGGKPKRKYKQSYERVEL